MQELHQLEIVINLFLQGLGHWLQAPLEFFSFLGSEEFYLMAIPFLFWCVSPLIGLRFGLILVFSNAANLALKMAFHLPRPYWIDSRVQALASETTYGLPSNHSQTAVVLWGYAARQLRKPWAILAAIAIVAFIGLSRLYLGVHFFSDLLAGWLIGGLILFLVALFETRITAWIARTSLAYLLLASVLASMVVILVILLASALSTPWPIPPSWIATALAATPGTPIAPLDPTGAFTLAGTLLGTLAGSAWMFRKVGGFSADGTLSQKTARYCLGMLVVLILWYGLGKVFPRDASPLAFGLRYLRYVLIGSWTSLFAPLLFRRLGWLKRP